MAADGKQRDREGKDLLGSPTFEPLENGRFRCVESGHETPAHAIDSYAKSKRCRLGLIEFALSKQKPPLNMFKQDPLSRSKLICKLTGDTVNKSEEHIWKHINGRRFLNKLELMESGDYIDDVNVDKKESKKESVEGGSQQGKSEKKKKKKKKEVEEIVSEIRESVNDSDSEEADFWMPPHGMRWDFDDGGDRWGSESDSEDHDGADEGDIGEENGVSEENGDMGEENGVSEDLSTRAKRMSLEIGPSSFASRKKKKRTSSSP